MFRPILIALALALGSVAPASALQAPVAAQVEAAYSPDGGAEALVLRALASAQRSIRLAAYSFTSPPVVAALLDARRRGVDVRVVLDDKGNRSRASRAALNLVVNAGIPARTVSAFAIHHDKYIVIDGSTVETGSFNFSAAAAKSNSENVMVVWNHPALAAQYVRHWQSRWERGDDVVASY